MLSNLEIFANVTTAICIYLAGRKNINTWWVGIVACVAFGFLFYDAKLYADVALQGFFIITGFIGWFNWKNLGECTELPIRSASKSVLLQWGVVAFIFALIYARGLYMMTDAYAPLIDSLVLTFSIFGQVLLMNKFKETWLVWILVNVLSVPLYFSRELYLTSGLYFLFLVNAIVSWFGWNNSFKQQENTIKLTYI